MDFRMQNRRPRLTLEEKWAIDEKTEEGWSAGAIGELLSRPKGTIESYLSRLKNPSAYIFSSHVTFDGHPDMCMTCGERLRHGTDNGFRVEWCRKGCRETVNPAYLGEFRVDVDDALAIVYGPGNR